MFIVMLYIYFHFTFRYFQDLLSKSNLQLKIGLVQTAYANGASTDYIENKLVNFIIAFLYYDTNIYKLSIYFSWYLLHVFQQA